jgi:protein phosphatase
MERLMNDLALVANGVIGILQKEGIDYRKSSIEKDQLAQWRGEEIKDHFVVEYDTCRVTFTDNNITFIPTKAEPYIKSAFSKSYRRHRSRRLNLNIAQATTLEYADPKTIDVLVREIRSPSRNDASVATSDMSKIKDRYLVVGDIHGCLDELQDLLIMLEFRPEKDWLISVGDLIDRGPKNKETVEFLMGLPKFRMTIGNHDDKFLRWMKGRNVRVAHGLIETIEEFGTPSQEVLEFFDSAPCIIRMPKHLIVHAGFDPDYDERNQTRSACLYTRYIGGKDAFDTTGKYWSKLWDMEPVMHGHEPKYGLVVKASNNVLNLDGGCVFGGYLRIWDSRTETVTSIKARREYSARR